MNSREKILAAVKNNQPPFVAAPALPAHAQTPDLLIAADPQALADIDQTAKFITILESIGGTAFIVPGLGSIPAILREQYPSAKKIVTIAGLVTPDASADPHNAIIVVTPSNCPADPHALADTDLAILPAQFGVAENSACWITEDLMGQRALPFICEHLAVVIDQKNIVPTMHEAYERIGNADYGFGTFIAGPSKTADIEQSLVLGAHGPKTTIVFIVDPRIPGGAHIPEK